MEKAVVFGPLVIFFVFFGLLIVLFLGFIVKLVLKSKNESWEGEVIDKKINQVDDDETGSHNYYYLVVKLVDGKERKIALSLKMFKEFEIGDKIRKPKGKLFPEKI